MNLRLLRGLLPFLLTALVAGAATNYATPYSFSTVAGLSSVGNDDGPGQVARFYRPTGLARDARGNLYVADHENNTIRKVTPEGVVSTLAGSPGVRGSLDGNGSDALFINPDDTAVDAAGTVYVADKINSVIRKITPEGIVTTLAGSPGRTGLIDGTGSEARFQIPTGLAIDPAGNLFVADQINNAIRKVTPAGVVTTYAGRTNPYTALDGPVATAGFFYPYRVALDAQGNLYVTEAGNNVVRKITADGMVSTLAGKAGVFGDTDGQGAAARFRGVAGITTDAAGNVYVTDGGNHTIRKVTPAGNTTTIVGTAGTGGSTDATGNAALFVTPDGLTSDAAGNLYVTDRSNNTVRKISPALAVTTIAGLPEERTAGTVDGSLTAARFSNLAATAVGPDGEVYVADTINSTVRKISRQGAVTTLAGKAGVRGTADGTGDQARFDSPYGITVAPDGTLFVTDAAANTIRKVTPQGVVTTLAGNPDAQPGSVDGAGRAARFNYPAGLALGRDGALYVADRDNYLVRKVALDGTVTTYAGTANSPGRGNGPGPTAHFINPVAVAADAAGNLFVAEGDRHGGIRVVAPDRTVSTLAGGNGGIEDAVDGQGLEARFNGPSALAVDGTGAIYVADGHNCTVRKVSATGLVTTLAGLTGAVGNADGTGKKSRFFYPLGLSLDALGGVYVTSGTTVRRGLLATAPLIATQPTGQSATAGTKAQFSVTAEGVPQPTYQWQFNGTAIAGATGSSLSLTNVGAADAGEYTVVVTNPLGSVTSAKATLTVTAAPVTPTPPPASAGGGGGAPSPWFLLALGWLRWLRWVRSQRRQRR